MEELNRLTERDFLTIGERMTGFRAAARQIAADLTLLTELIAGEQNLAASRCLSEILRYTQQLDSRIQRGGDALEEIRELSRRICHCYGGVRNTVSVFRTLCTLTRIETSRLAGASADFGDLAAEVMPLSESIRTSGESVLAVSSRLDESIRQALVRGDGFRRKHAIELPALVAGVTSGLPRIG